VAVLALEGVALPPGEPPRPVRAPLPAEASATLDRLMGVRDGYETVEQLRKELEATRDRPTEVTRLRRAGHLVLATLLLHVPLGAPLLLLLVSFLALWRDRAVDPASSTPVLLVCGYAGACLGFWVSWAFLFRSGLTFWGAGVALRRMDGRKASRLQCALRALIVWAPLFSLLCLAVAAAEWWPDTPWPGFVLWGAAAALLAAYPALALWTPARGPHDRLAGTFLVPAHFTLLPLLPCFLVVMVLLGLLIPAVQKVWEAAHRIQQDQHLREPEGGERP
jgi:hypothetical protein